MQNTHRADNHEHFRRRCHLSKKDLFPVPPVNVTMILTGFEGHLELPHELAKSDCYKTLCSRKVRLSCLGLE